MKTIECALFSLLLLLLSACTPPPTTTLTPLNPTATPGIGHDQAIELATGACRMPHLVLVGEPHNIRSELLTLDAAFQKIDAGSQAASFGLPLDTRVWLVQMDGTLQLAGGPPTLPPADPLAATSTPPQPFAGTCQVILDAGIGAILSVHN